MTDPKEAVAGIPTYAEGAMEAPVIYFESTPTYAISGGVGQIVLEMLISEVNGPGGTPRSRRRVVAHLRGPLAAFDTLRRAINEMEAMITPKPGEKAH